MRGRAVLIADRSLFGRPQKQSIISVGRPSKEDMYPQIQAQFGQACKRSRSEGAHEVYKIQHVTAVP